MQRPTGVTVIGGLFLVVAGYVSVVGAVMLASAGTVSMAWGAPLLGGLEVAGPYMFLLMGVLGCLIGVGLLRLDRWARWAAILAGLVGVVMLAPTVASAVFEFRISRLVWGGLGVMLRVLIVWYLYQGPVVQRFEANKAAPAAD